MKLPTELRLEVLRKLLVTDEIYFMIYRNCTTAYVLRKPTFEKTFKFCIAILRTCRQLYREGMPILYEQNTFDISRCAHDWSFRPQENAISSTLAGCLHRLHLGIVLDAQNPRFIRQRMAKFALQIEFFPKLQYLSIELRLWSHCYTKNVEGEVPTEVAEEIVQALNLVRGLKTVELTGLTPTYATELIARMTSRDPVNLTHMFGALEYYLSATGLVGNWSMMNQFQQQLREARDAMDEKDQRRFFAVRDTILKGVEAELRRARQDYFKNI